VIAAIIARLIAQVPALKMVGSAAAFQQASETNPRATPAAYVFTVDESADENSLGDPMIQKIEVTLAIVLVVRQVGDTLGAGAGADMDSLRVDVLAALLGYRPSTGHDPLARRQSALLAFRDGHMWWQETWSTRYFAVAN
jgi:hypothetical protein